MPDPQPLTYFQLPPEQKKVVDKICVQHSQARETRRPSSCYAHIEELPEKLRLAAWEQILESEIMQFAANNEHEFLPTLSELKTILGIADPIVDQAYRQVNPRITFPDTVLGKYRLVKMIHQSGQSRAFLASDEINRRTLFVKISNDPRQVAHLKQEANLLGRLSHQSIVPLVGSELQGDQYILVLQNLPAQSLLDYAKTHELDDLDVARIGIGLCDIVQFLHENKIMHGDIKPENILCKNDGHLWLIDFGYATDFDQGPYPKLDNVVFGETRMYMPPEIAGGKEHVDGPLVDQFCVGGTLFYLISGKHPRSCVVSEGGRVTFPLNEIVAPGRDERFLDLCRRAMHEDPEERFPSVAKLGDELRELAEILDKDKSRDARRRSMFVAVLFASVIALFTVWLGAVTFGWQPFRGSSLISRDTGKPKTAMEWRIENYDINVDSLNEKSFQPRLVLEESPGWPGMPPNIGKLYVGNDSSLFQLTPFMEYRLGDGKWRSCIPNKQQEWYCFLTAKDIEQNLPVFIQFDALGGEETGDYILGPFQLDIDLAQAMADALSHKTQDGQTEIAKLTWLDSNDNLWSLPSELVVKYGEAISEIRYGTSGDTLDRSISVSDSNGQRLIEYEGSNRNVQKQLDRLLQSKLGNLADERALYCQICYLNGSKSEVRKFARTNPFGHDGSIDSAIDLLNSEANGPPATFSSLYMRLNGIARVAEAIDFIEVGPSRDHLKRRIEVEFRRERPPLGFTPSARSSQADLSSEHAMLKSREDNGVLDSITVYRGFVVNRIYLPPIWEQVWIQVHFLDGRTFGPVSVKNDLPLPGHQAKVIERDLEPGHSAELYFYCQQFVRASGSRNGHQTVVVRPFVLPPVGCTRFSAGDKRYLKPPWLNEDYEGCVDDGRLSLEFFQGDAKAQGKVVFEVDRDRLDRDQEQSVSAELPADLSGFVKAFRVSGNDNGREFLDSRNRMRTDPRAYGAYHAMRARLSKEGPLIVVGIPHSRPEAWGAIDSVQIGPSKDELNVSITPNHSIYFLSSKAPWWNNDPAFVKTVEGDPDFLFVRFHIADGTQSEVYKIPVEVLEYGEPQNDDSVN